MKTMIVGDMHLKESVILPLVDELLGKLGKVERLVFTGDICDQWDATEQTFNDELKFFDKWINAKESEGIDVDLVFGNHDFAYISFLGGPGYLEAAGNHVRHFFNMHPKTAIATTVGKYLITHGGLVDSWASNYLEPNDNFDRTSVKGIAEALNKMLEDERYDELYQAGPGRGGYELPSPLWADKEELLFSAYPGISQIVGHTPVSTCVKEKHPGTNSELWFCDTFSLEGKLINPNNLGSISLALAQETGQKFCYQITGTLGDGSVLLIEDNKVSVEKTEFVSQIYDIIG
jgi:predicted phosphodiesterase